MNLRCVLGNLCYHAFAFCMFRYLVSYKDVAIRFLRISEKRPKPKAKVNRGIRIFHQLRPGMVLIKVFLYDIMQL